MYAKFRMGPVTEDPLLQVWKEGRETQMSNWKGRWKSDLGNVSEAAIWLAMQSCGFSKAKGW